MRLRRFMALALWGIALAGPVRVAAQAAEAPNERVLLITDAEAIQQRLTERQAAFCEQKLREAPRQLKLEIPARDATGPEPTIPPKELDGIFCFIHKQTMQALRRGDLVAARKSARFNIDALAATGLCPTESAFLSYKAGVRAFAAQDDIHSALLNLMLAACTQHIMVIDAPIQNTAAIAESAAFALERRDRYQLPAQAAGLAAGQLAYILINMSVEQREKWAATFMSYYAQHPEVLAEQGFSPELRDQMVAVATGLSGDWPKAATLYRQIAAQRTSDHEWLNPPRSSGGGGLMNIITWPNRIRDETLTALAMAGQAELAICLLDESQLDVSANRCSQTPQREPDTREPVQATVRILTTNLGTLIIGSRSDAPATAPLVQLHPSLSSIRTIWRVDGSSKLRVHGLVQMLQGAQMVNLDDPRLVPQMKILFDSAAQVADELVGAPIRSMLNRLGVPEGGEVAIITSGAAGLLPIAASRPSNGRPLGSQYAISVSLSAANSTSGEPIHLPTAIRVAGGSTDLPNVPLELGNVRYWDEGEGASFSGLTELGQGIPPRIIHISNHADYRPNVPGASAITLSGSAALTIADVERWRPQKPPRLVILSGCQTGLLEFSSSVRDQRSLARAFLQAGVQGVVASTWPVEDLSTALLMSRFYDNLAAGQSPRRALFTAQRWIAAATALQLSNFIQDQIRAKKIDRGEAGEALAVLMGADLQLRPFADPIYWAGFQLFGS